MHYSFQGNAPISEPILILNGEGEGPINNVCFPSVVNESYSPPGFSLCSVALAKSTMEMYRGKDHELDKAVRTQMAGWFEEYREDIFSKWERKGNVYEIQNAQPSQLGGPLPASFYEGRSCNIFGDLTLPSGMYLCGDYMVSF